jgi:hypothetical protein
MTTLARLLLPALLLLALAVPASAQTPTPTVTPTDLRCEYRVDPLGIDSPHPRLRWILTAADPAARGLAQSAYQILVASSPTLLEQSEGDLWDSGKVMSDQMSQVPYNGKALASLQACYWKVRVWDQGGTLSPWSAPAQWTMGILSEDDWSGAKWIGAPWDGKKPSLEAPLPKYESVLLRHEFTVKPGLKRAVVTVCGLGQYEMTFNGKRVGDDLLAPGWTEYDKTCLYQTYDVTALLAPGANAAGLFLGNGMYLQHGGRYASNTHQRNWFGPIQARGVLRLEYADGTVETIVTDDQWRCLSGPITFSSGYGGEDFDARLEQADWNMPHLNDAKWDHVQLLNGPGGALKGLSCSAPPIHAFQALAPISAKPTKPGVTLYDLGQNASIMLRLTARGPAGSMVSVTPDELVKPDGTPNGAIFGHKPIGWRYTLKGGGADETYFSKFFYVGSRYLQVELIPAKPGGTLPKVQSIAGVVVHADSPAVGTFTCSNDLFNRIYTLVRWAQQNNMMSLLTDCPTREKRGWLEQDHLNGPALRYNWDLAALSNKITNDMADSQHVDGMVPSTAPDFMRTSGKFEDSPEWSSACALVPWQQYEFEGDTDLLRRAYPMMQRYQVYLASKTKENVGAFGLGDWYDIGPKHLGTSQLTPLALTTTAFYFEDTFLLSKIAKIIGKDDDAARYTDQAEAIRLAFNRALFHVASHQYGDDILLGSQCSDSIPLAMNIAEPADRMAVLNNIVQDVRTRGLTAGDVGYRYLLRALADGGRSDVIYALNNQSDKPGYGYQLKLGKTSLTEGWNGSDSQDHFMLGQINEWLFHDLGGIQADAPGFRRIEIKPAIVGDLTHVKTSFDSISGPIVSEWTRDGATLTLHIVIPPNTSATVAVPTGNPAAVRESDQVPSPATGLRFLKVDGDAALYEVGSGDYTFRSTLPADSSN